MSGTSESQILASAMGSKSRSILTKSDAVCIFKKKNSISTASQLAILYGVSEKAIRDIWTGRTWSRETLHFDSTNEIKAKTLGRSRGIQDAKPRSRAQKNVLNYVARYNDGLSKTSSGQSFSNVSCLQGNPGPNLFLQAQIPAFGTVSNQCQMLEQTLDDLLYCWELSARSCIADPFKQDWILSINANSFEDIES
jgi:hypothetical protein